VVAVSVGVMDSSEATRDSASRRAEIRAATRTVTELVASLWQVQGAELGSLLGEFDALAAVACGARVAVVGEAESRGEISASQAGSTAGWVAEHAPTLAAGSGAGQVARLVRECARPDLSTVHAAAISGAVSVPAALTVVTEYARLKPRLREEAAPTVLQGLLDMGIADGPKGVRSLRPALLAAHGADGEFQADADTAERLVSLSRPSTDELGALTYQLVLDPAGAAALEAAIGPLSAPVPGPDGERDTRSPQLRRGQALIEVCRRATSAGDRPPSGVKTTLMLTMSYDDLAARVGAATVVGFRSGRLPDRAGDGASVGVRRERHSQPSWVVAGRFLTRVARLGWRRLGSWRRSGYGIVGAVSPAARLRRIGATPTTWSIGPTAGHQTSPTWRCCAGDTTPSSTETNWPATSPTRVPIPVLSPVLPQRLSRGT
jgi:hypothetical protein